MRHERDTVRRHDAIADALRLCLACAPLAADTYPRQRAVDALHYAFTLALTDESAAITGEARVAFRIVDPALGEVWLDLVGANGGRG